MSYASCWSKKDGQKNKERCKKKRYIYMAEMAGAQPPIIHPCTFPRLTSLSLSLDDVYPLPYYYEESPSGVWRRGAGCGIMNAFAPHTPRHRPVRLHQNLR
eukprot:gene11235-7805_t